MSKGQKISDILKPLASCSEQCYVGVGLHTLGLLGWILGQTGRAEVFVSTFSTSEAFLNGIVNLRQKKLIDRATLVVDIKASQKTIHLNKLMNSAFERVRLTLNHSKILLVYTPSVKVTVVTSQNQTYGDRAECTLISTSNELYLEVLKGYRKLIDKDKSILLNIHKHEQEIGGDICADDNNRTDGQKFNPDIGDWQPIGI